MKEFEIISLVLLVIAIALLVIVLLTLKKKDSHPHDKEALNDLKNDLSRELTSLFNTNNNNTQNSLALIQQQMDSLTKRTASNIQELSEKVAATIKELQQENTKSLDKIRDTVDEKLDKTLNERLSKSFEIIRNNLSSVEQGLGEMKNLAGNVDSLKRVLSNAKTRGILGEVSLGSILQEILAPEQYAENVATIPSSKERVEFAVKLPGKDDICYMPIDSKFPLDTYEALLDAYESGDKDLIKKAQAEMRKRVREEAKDIKTKYVKTPHTTEFGILFMPIEGMFSEAVKIGLFEEIQKDFKIVLAGPTTTAALLNSLQMGFRTLAIEKKSSEVWEVLSAVKSEFANFTGVLTNVQKHLSQTSDQLESLITTRTNKINSKLKKVEILDYVDSKKVLELDDENVEEQ